ncbi:MAG: heavy-metal-associated domain-containing protein [Aquabacterium sp.]
MSSTQTHQVQVKGMSCQHCVKAVTKALQTQDADAQVQVDLPNGQVQVVTAMSREAVIHTIEEEGYEVQS